VAGFLFALVVAGVVALSGHEVRPIWTAEWRLPVIWSPYETARANRVVFDLLFINIFWGLLNLLPIYPLDGGQISRELFGLADRSGGIRQSLYLSLLTAVAMAVVAFMKLHDQFLAFFFGYLAYISYQGLQSGFGSPRGWGDYR
jgi:Zn-dependent protease